MAKFKFELTAGCTIRGDIRTHLNRSKSTLEYEYPGASVTITEEKGWFDSHFWIQGLYFPDTDQFVKNINGWFDQLKKLEK